MTSLFERRQPRRVDTHENRRFSLETDGLVPIVLVIVRGPSRQRAFKMQHCTMKHVRVRVGVFLLLW